MDSEQKQKCTFLWKVTTSSGSKLGSGPRFSRKIQSSLLSGLQVRLQPSLQKYRSLLNFNNDLTMVNVLKERSKEYYSKEIGLTLVDCFLFLLVCIVSCLVERAVHVHGVLQRGNAVDHSTAGPARGDD